MKREHPMEEYLKTIYKALDDKKAEDIQIIDIHEVSYMADYFIIANGTNVNQVHALCDNVSEEMAKLKMHTKQTEGYASGNWILMDYGDIIIHIFDKESRSYYDLERIWKDGKVVELDQKQFCMKCKIKEALSQIWLSAFCILKCGGNQP